MKKAACKCPVGALGDLRGLDGAGWVAGDGAFGGEVVEEAAYGGEPDSSGAGGEVSEWLSRNWVLTETRDRRRTSAVPEFDYLTANEAAERAGVSRRTITRWIATGRLASVTKLPGDTGAHLFRPEDVDAAAEAVAS